MILRHGTDPRYAYQWRNAEMPVLNVGCESDPVGFAMAPGTVNMDIDDWSGATPAFVRHDACLAPWPFGDKTFDTVVFGDCLDHMDRPDVALREARRAARRAIVVTLPKDTPTAPDDDYVKHVEDLRALGLRETAPGDLRRRHGHHDRWTEERVRKLLDGLPPYDLASVPSGSPGDRHWYWGAVVRLDCEDQPAPPARLPKMSVLLCSYRPGGLDVTFSGLGAQDYHGEWEVIFVDELFAQRVEVVRGEAFRAGLQPHRLRHVPNLRSLHPRDSTGRAHNEAIVRAGGEVAVWLTDYAAVPPDWLTRHAAVRSEVGGDALVVNAAFYNVWAPPLHDCVRPAPIAPDDMRAVLRASIFARPLSWREAQQLPLQGRSLVGGAWTRSPSGQDEASTRYPDGPVTYEYYFMKHDSAPLDLLRSVGGNDESFDGLHKYHDTELGLRLAAAGAKFWHSKAPAIRVVQVRHLMSRLVAPAHDGDGEAQGAALMADTRERVSRGVLAPRETHPELRP